MCLSVGDIVEVSQYAMQNANELNASEMQLNAMFKEIPGNRVFRTLEPMVTGDP